MAELTPVVFVLWAAVSILAVIYIVFEPWFARRAPMPEESPPRTFEDAQREAHDWNEHAISLLLERGAIDERTAAEVRLHLARLMHQRALTIQ